MIRARVLSIGVVGGWLLGLISAATPAPAYADFNVGAQLWAITPTAAVTVDGTLIDPTCGSQGGTSLALVQGSKVAGISPFQHPVLPVVTCLDNGNVSIQNRLNFLDPIHGNVLKAIQTFGAQGRGWAHLVNRPDKGNLLACSDNGSLFSIVYNQFDLTQVVKSPVTPPGVTLTTGNLARTTYNVRYTYTTPEGETVASNRAVTPSPGGGKGGIGITVTAGALPARATGIAVYISVVGSGVETKQGTSSTNVYTQTATLVAGAPLPTTNTTGGPGSVTAVARPTGLPTNCTGLAWDAEEDTIYQGVTGSNNVVGVHRFKDQSNPTDTVFNLPQCTPSGIAITGGVLIVPCSGSSTILRLDKTTGATLSADGTVNATGLTPLSPDPGLGGLACDPVTFQEDPLRPGKDQFKDGMWSRRGPNGNGLVALEFPAFTCGLPSSATVLKPGLASPSCFENVTVGTVTVSRVKDSDGDGLPNCWEDGTLWSDGKPGINFAGEIASLAPPWPATMRDLKLCVMVDTNGSGAATTEECADKDSKDIFVEIDYMEHHKPNPLALSQPQPVTSVTSVREAFNAAPVSGSSSAFPGIKIHFQVDEQVAHADWLVLTPCTGPLQFSQDPLSTADFDVIKKASFGTSADRADLTLKRLNAKRLAFHYMLFAHQQVGTSAPTSGSLSSGCSEVAGDDVVITLGGFTSTTETENAVQVTHNRGSQDEQAGTVMHELGHNLGLRHGGHDNVNCKPNYLSVMSYSRQFAGSPIPNRPLTYSRADLGDLDKSQLNEQVGLGVSSSLVGDTTTFGPTTWTVVPADAPKIDWNKNLTFDATLSSADINSGPNCDAGTPNLLEGHNDWDNLNYRFSAALDFGSGAHPTANDHISINATQALQFFLAADLDGNNIGDAVDCGTLFGGALFTCEHRIDVRPSSSSDPSGAKVFSLGANANISVAIFSELCTNSTPPVVGCPTQPSLGNGLWSAPAEVIITGDPKDFPVLHVGTVTIPVKTNNNGNGTCSIRNLQDPKTGLDDGQPDMICQFDTSGLAPGAYTAYVTGKFRDPNTLAKNGFQGRQRIIITP